MPVIYQLLKTLNEQELKKVSTLPFQERERDVLQVMLHINNKVFPSSTVCKKLKITTSHLDKINSILLKKIIESLAGKNIYDQIFYLNHKNGLWHAVKRIINNHEQKVILHSNDKNEKFIFYKFCFEWLITIASDNDNDLNHYAKMIIENCDESKLKETELWIKIVLFRKEINLAASQALFNNPEKQKALIFKLQETIAEAERINSAQCLYKAKLAGVVLNNILQQFEHSKILINDINLLFKTKADQFSQNDILIAQWHHAQKLYYSGSFNESFDLYHKLFDELDEKGSSKWYIFITEYFQVSLITNHNDIAKELLSGYYSKFYNDSNGSFYLSALIQYVKYLLFTHQYDKANSNLKELQKQTSKTSSLQFQFALRELTLAQYYLTGDFNNAMVVAEKNLKFMRSKKIHTLIPEYTYHSRLTKSIIKIKQKARPFTADESDMYLKMQAGTLSQYGLLLKRLLMD